MFEHEIGRSEGFAKALANADARGRCYPGPGFAANRAGAQPAKAELGLLNAFLWVMSAHYNPGLLRHLTHIPD
jgi:hypothetical protein